MSSGERAKRPGKRPGRVAPTMLGALGFVVAQLKAEYAGKQWPNPQWQSDPVGFVREVLRELTIFPWQAEILEAIRDNKRVAVRSGQKCCKTTTLIWAALWWYCSFPQGTVVLTASTADQIRKVLWKQLGKTLFNARARGFELAEDIGVSPATGMTAPDTRTLYGFTARDVASAAGISAAHILFLVDEASALQQDFAEAIEGNTAGGDCRILYISNPIETEGPFYDAFHSAKEHWKTFHLSSEKVAQYCESHGIRVQGVAHAGTIREWELHYGRDSPFFLARALGEFIHKESGRIIGVGDIVAAVERWESSVGAGPLAVGVDPAGHGDGGDEWGFAVVRGVRCLAVFRMRGLTIDQGLARLEGIFREYRQGEETPRVCIDSEGSIGADFYGRCRALSEHYRHTNPRIGFEAYGIKASNPATRQPREYVKVRDELWANLGVWIKGGSIPADSYLETELHAPFFVGCGGGRVQATPKKVLRDKLGRSPDTADALALGVWNPTPWGQGENLPEKVAAPAIARESSLPEDWREEKGPWGGGIDPYG